MKHTSEQILSFAENELINKESIRRAVLSKAPERQKKPVAWAKILLPVAACLVLLCGAVLAIPKARAEVFSWFGVSRPADYLTTDPSERPDVPELDALIASPAATDEVVTIPIDRTDSEAVNSEGAMKVSAFLHENCDVALGEAMFDGETLYQSIRLNGLSGLYLLEPYTGTYTTALTADSNREWPNGWIVYEMPDGTRFYGSMDLSSSIDGYLKYLSEKGLAVENKTDEQRNEIDAENRTYLAQNGLMAVAEVHARDYEKYLDADGNLTAKAYYRVSITEEDGRPDTELYDAQIGTITVNMKAYQNIESSGVTADGASVVWGAETVTISKADAVFCVNGTDKDQRTFIKHRVSMEGVTMTADTENVEMDALGIRKVGIRITFPATWTDAQKEAFAASLEFDVLVDGERGDWYAQYTYCEVQEDGSVLWMSDEIYGVPYDLLKTMKTITFLPQIHGTEKVEEYDSDWNYLNTIEPAYGEIGYGIVGAEGWRSNADVTDFPQYAITLHVN